MRYKDLLRKRRDLSEDAVFPGERSGAPISRPDDRGGTQESMPGDAIQEAGVEEYLVGDTVVGEGGKESELERLYYKMEKFMSYGHSPLSLDEEAERSVATATLVREESAGVREDCIAPTNGETNCWDLNQQVGTRTFEECFECQVYQGQPADFKNDERLNLREAAIVHETEKRSAEAMYERFVSSIKGMYQDARTKKYIDLDAARRIAEELLEKVPADTRLLWQAINARKGSQIASHVLNVAIFSIKVGIGLKLGPDDLLLLTMASVLHDLGMTWIPDSIIQKKAKLTRKEYELIKKHPIYSVQIIENSEKEHGTTGVDIERLRRIIGEEHERENGSGYPEGKQSAKIDDLAKVIGVLDVFEALSHDRGHRSEYSSFQAVQVIIQMRNEFFSTRVVKAVITQISIFPLESHVMLNNGEIGKVVKTNYAHPMRPVIEIIRDSKGKKVKQEREVDLSKNPLIFITRPVGEEEL